MTPQRHVRSVSPFISGMWAHVPEPPEHDPSIPPETPPQEPDREVDLPPREAPDEIRDPVNPRPEDPPMRAVPR